MSFEQIELFGVFGLVLAMLLWGRFRHDLVAALKRLKLWTVAADGAARQESI